MYVIESSDGLTVCKVMNTGKHPSKLTFRLLLIIAAVALLAFTATSASAQVYKCVGAKNQTTYSDKPCTNGATQALTNTEPSLSIDADSARQIESSIMLQMDAAVKTAIADDDYTRAQALAITEEQREWISTAKKQYDTRITAGKLQTSAYPDKGNSAECQQAKRSLEQAANGISSAEALNAKTSLMNAACGIQPATDYFYGGPVLPLYYHGYGHKPPYKSGYTSPPYDRTTAKPFGSRFIRPENIQK